MSQFRVQQTFKSQFSEKSFTESELKRNLGTTLKQMKSGESININIIKK